jgi:alpha-1,3-glucosyltransferase
MQSYVHGLFVGQFDPAAVALHTSRGYETYFSKQLLRWTVILSDLLSEGPQSLSSSHHSCTRVCQQL